MYMPFFVKYLLVFHTGFSMHRFGLCCQYPRFSQSNTNLIGHRDDKLTILPFCRFDLPFVFQKWITSDGLDPCTAMKSSQTYFRPWSDGISLTTGSWWMRSSCRSICPSFSSSSHTAIIWSANGWHNILSECWRRNFETTSYENNMILSSGLVNPFRQCTHPQWSCIAGGCGSCPRNSFIQKNTSSSSRTK